jgi:hypothetical protein
VFQAVPAKDSPGEDAIRYANTARVLPAVPPPTAPDPAAVPAGTPAPAAPPVPPSAPPAPEAAAAPVPAPDPAGSAAIFELSDPYPGDGAPKEQLAQWMARQAHRAGLPPELPVMAGLVESGLSNLDHGDADSVGYFQMRAMYWDKGEYAGYAQNPELQVKWFIDQAVAIREKRLAAGLADFGSDPAGYGEWIADVERPAEQYRGRYQLRLEEARGLIWGAQPR